MGKDSGDISGSREPSRSVSALTGFDPGRGACRACRARGKTWEGSDPSCAFDGGALFSDNWNCATVGLIRDLCPRFEAPVSKRVSVHCDDDQYWAVIDLVGIDVPSDYASALWMSWYKSRGRTEAMWLLNESAKPWLPSEDDLLAISAAIAMETRRAETTGSVAKR